MITKTNQGLSDVFDVTPTLVSNEVALVDMKIEDSSEPKAKQKSQDEDFELVRITMHNLLLKGQEAIENALVIANGTEEADSYNAVSNLIGKMTDASVKLMGMHEIKQKIESKPVVAPSVPASVEPNTTNFSGPVFVGSTSELAKMIATQRASLINNQNN